MLFQIAIATLILASVKVQSEPLNNQYGTPIAAPISSYGTPNYNADAHNHEYSEPKAYEFGYQVKDDYSGNNYKREEASDGNQVRGEYRVQLPDGRTQIVTYYADWQTGFHADVRYEGTAVYPEQYNQHNQYNAPSNQYGAPFGGNNYQNNGNYNGAGSYQNGGNYNGAGATSSVTIKDYNSGSGYNNGGNSYNNGYNNGGRYDNYNSGGFGGTPAPVYGAP